MFWKPSSELGWVYPLHIDTHGHVGYQDQEEEDKKMIYVMARKHKRMNTGQDPIISTKTIHADSSCLLTFVYLSNSVTLGIKPLACGILGTFKIKTSRIYQTHLEVLCRGIGVQLV